MSYLMQTVEQLFSISLKHFATKFKIVGFWLHTGKNKMYSKSYLFVVLS